ncbi:Lrp/AsnC family transcriptional regulator [Staphylococcus massiliensis]|uniref:AsnC family transcriptional regulator n=1 Tax=Staphylococcus massiliensis S46 TaxID=1229783 RepID=K9B6K5_9STAP|nr:Lrp/AsnC family transcriptional regulator [Staphylococcus massiliensis]EKU50432.1 AsnC family transcriptional regulator [Staphylococcus massiliensis S46]MCG3398798.1 Lrp/AsnC family transcriptional regulator [Staphylococcus massiliensis]MCG3401359.1 Lrp/AsnC family transcriptional regulator [Staphylococcus massiliensis]MCG3411859.1 Lrp/AsnC family transcriptional regulator [Staphylococcus massiliensis]POA00493.1 Lrp/AsnC family transcriptional regulator [Staphylococcus massiliensis CCUG 559
MDHTNEKILKILHHDSRTSLRQISNEVNLSTPSVRDRINKMLDLGMIQKYTIDIDYATLGYEIEILVDITTSPAKSSYFNDFIQSQENVKFCYRVSGPSCYLFKAIFRNMKEVESFVETLKKYGSSKTFFILSKIV